MSEKNTTYSKQIIDIADYIFANPDKKTTEVLSVFVGICRKSERTIERYIQKAQEYNKERLQRHESIKAEAEDKEIKEAVKSNILSRNESLEILSKIAKGELREIDEEKIAPSDSERIKAITTIADIEGWKAPVKSEQKVLTSTIVMNVVDSNTPLANNEDEVLE